MPDSAGLLTSEEIKKFQDWLAKYQPGDVVCPICRSTKWIVGQHIVQPLTLAGNMSIQMGGPGYPHILLISNPCGYTIFVNAVIAGILPTATVPPAAPPGPMPGSTN